MVAGDSLSLSSSFEKPISSACHGKNYFLRDEGTNGCTINSNIQQKLSCPKNVFGNSWKVINRGGGFIPAGYNPFGYQITELGQTFLEFDGSLDSDVGRFLASVKTRKRFDAIKSQWVEILRVSKKGQSMRIYRQLEELIAFCIKAGFLD
mmetsp:Transcript_11326/g.24045  ORF Transcript_11326/g.24045 Transcript_11326/m.24045 type:complete len:150 (+) Transcript_11326:243-692(+)